MSRSRSFHDQCVFVCLIIILRSLVHRFCAVWTCCNIIITLIQAVDRLANVPCCLQDIRSMAPKNERPDPPPLPANPPNSARITKPAYRPPPPPSQPPRVNRIPGHQPGGAIPPPPPPPPPPAAFSPPPTSNPPTPIMAQMANFAKIDDDDVPPPPPPPRGASCCSELMERFKFIPISELPRPAKFSGSKKVYDYHAGRKNANALAAQ